jgi:hypothetical protein
MSRENRQKPMGDAKREGQPAADPQPPQPEKVAGRQRLGKEAKIGAAVILALLAALVVAAVIRFSGGRTTGPVAAAPAKGKEKAAAVNKGTNNASPDRGRSGPIGAPTAARSAPPWATAASDPLAEPPETLRRDADPVATGGFPALSAPRGPQATAIDRRADILPPPWQRRELTRHDVAPTDDPFRSRPQKAVNPAPASGTPRAAPNNPAQAAGAPGRMGFSQSSSGAGFSPPSSKSGAPRARGTSSGAGVSPWPSESSARRAPAAAPARPVAALGGEASLPAPRRPRGREEDFDLEPGGSTAASSYGEPPPRELPYRASAAALRREYRASRTYTVAEGETLFTIARYELGKAARWIEIYELNRDALGRDLSSLRPGTRLLLPSSERSDVLAQPSNGTYRR